MFLHIYDGVLDHIIINSGHMQRPKKIVEEATDLDVPVIRPPMTGDGKNLSA